MYINLDERPVANASEAMDLPCLDDKDVAGAGFEFFPIDRPEAPTFSDELDFIVRMAMGARAPPRQRAEEEGGDIDVAVLGSNELVRAALKWQVLLMDTVHPLVLPGPSRPYTPSTARPAARTSAASSSGR